MSIPSTPLAFAWFLTRDLKGWATGATLAVIIGQGLVGVNIVLLRSLVDTLTQSTVSGDFHRVWVLGILYPLVFLVMSIAWRVSGFCGMQWITRTEAAVHRTLFSYITDHSAAYFVNRFAGALTQKITNAAKGVERLIADFLWQFLSLGTKFLTSVVIALFADWRLALLVGIWVPMFLGINAYLVRRKRNLGRAAAAASSVLRGRMVDTAANILTVQHTGRHEDERQHLGPFIREYQTARLCSWMYSEWVLVANGVLQAFFIGFMLWGTLFLLQREQLSVGDVVMIVSLILSLQESLFFIGQKMNDFMENYSLVEEGLEDILVPHEIVDLPGAQDLCIREGSVVFRAVHFGYGRKKVLHGLTLAIPGGQSLGLVGISGAGKTTIVSLILRLYEVQAGAILIDDQNIRNVTRTSLRRNIAIVPQDLSLFHRTIRENIRYARPDATDEEVEQAARLAQAARFIEECPRGYDTYVGERGVKLSAGQRQRIAIARALLQDAPILILDEATSALDSESESAIQQALQTLMRGRTVLAIAHRLSTLQNMDRIVVLEGGAIQDDGTHGELLERDSLYRRLWHNQIGGFIQDALSVEREYEPEATMAGVEPGFPR